MTFINIISVLPKNWQILSLINCKNCAFQHCVHHSADKAITLQVKACSTPQILTPPSKEFPWDDLHKILPGCQQVTNVPNGIETLRKISIAWVGCTNVTDRWQTDGQTDNKQTTDLTYSKREREFTFAKNEVEHDKNKHRYCFNVRSRN